VTESTNIGGSAKGTFRVRVLPVGGNPRDFNAWRVVETHRDLDSALSGQMEFVKAGHLKEGEQIKVVRGNAVFYQPGYRTLYFWRTGYEMPRSMYPK
jgi:hypothetical protein